MREINTNKQPNPLDVDPTFEVVRIMKVKIIALLRQPGSKFKKTTETLIYIIDRSTNQSINQSINQKAGCSSLVSY